MRLDPWEFRLCRAAGGGVFIDLKGLCLCVRSLVKRLLYSVCLVLRGLMNGWGLLQRSGQTQRPSAITSILYAKNSLHNYTQLGKCMFLWRGPRPIIPSSRLAAFIKDNCWWPKMSLFPAFPATASIPLSLFLMKYPFQTNGFQRLHKKRSRGFIQGANGEQCVYLCALLSPSLRVLPSPIMADKIAISFQISSSLCWVSQVSISFQKGKIFWTFNTSVKTLRFLLFFKRAV